MLLGRIFELFQYISSICSQCLTIVLFYYIEFVISLNASDEFLRNRVMNLSEKQVSGTHNTEEGLQRRLVEYRAINTDDETVCNYFDELEIHPEHIGNMFFTTLTCIWHNKIESIASVCFFLLFDRVVYNSK